MTIAVIFVPAAAQLELFGNQCYDYCAAAGHDVLGIIRDWGRIAELWRSGAVDVVVVARPEHLDPDRVPRVEVVDPGGLPGRPRNQRRTRLIRGAGA